MMRSVRYWKQQRRRMRLLGVKLALGFLIAVPLLGFVSYQIARYIFCLRNLANYEDPQSLDFIDMDVDDTNPRKPSAGAGTIPSIRLMNIQDFKFIYRVIDNCTFDYNTNNSSLLLVFITSKKENFLARNFIRSQFKNFQGNDNTIVAQNWTIRLMFLISVNHGNILNVYNLSEEFRQYNDILVGNLPEDPKKIIYRSLMGLLWAHTNCQKGQYLLKTDDNVFVNVPEIISFLSNQTPSTNRIFCKTVNHDKVNRRQVHKSVFGEDEYPTYCDDRAIIMSMDLPRKFLLATQTVYHYYPRLNLQEDKWITGILRMKLLAQIDDIGEIILTGGGNN